MIEPRVWKQWVSWYVFGFFSFVTRLRVYDRARLNEMQNVIFVSNHQQFFDLVWIPWALRSLLSQEHKLYVLVHRENLVNSFAWRFLNWFFPVIQVDPGDRSVLDRCQSVLDQGHSVFLFPEGTFNLGYGELLPMYHGAANLSARSKCPIVSIGLQNTNMFRVYPFPLQVLDQLKTVCNFIGSKTKVQIGLPIPIPGTTDLDEIRAITNMVEYEIANLSGLRPFSPSEITQKIYQKTVTPTDYQMALEKMGIDVGSGFEIDWRSWVLLEKVYHLHQNKPMNISIGDNVKVGEKVYLFPGAVLESDKKYEVTMLGDCYQVESWRW